MKSDFKQEAIKSEYAHLASVYDKRWSFYVKATIRETVKRLDLKSQERVLDIGCGTGVLFQIISTRQSKVKLFGVDICFEMLQIAQKN